MKAIFPVLAACCLVISARAEEKKIEVTGNDQMQYNTKTLEATAGDTVVLTLKHIGQIPKAAMGHNLVLLKKDAVVADFAMKAIQAGLAKEYIPDDEDSKKAIVAHTKLLGGGESDTITFTAPTEPGSYPYLCTFPGHFAMMQGVLTVKAK